MEGQYKNIVIRKNGPITTITLDRPQKLNAISPGLIADLLAALPAIERDADTRAIVITGTGRAFSAGGDIQEDLIPVSKMTPREWRQYIHGFCDMIRTLFGLAKPVIAAINGVSVGGGCDLALACDIRIASDKAKFGYGYIKMGLIPDMGGNYFLPRTVGLGIAKLLAFTGDLIDAREAERIGLVDRVVPDADFKKEVEALVRKIANGPTAAITLIKEAMRRSLNMDLDTSLDYAASLQGTILDSEDIREGIRAFLEKRSPRFKGR